MRIHLGTPIVVCGLILLSGCNDPIVTGDAATEPPPEGYVSPPTTDHLHLVENPEFVSWSRFAVGTTVSRSKEVSSGAESMRVITTLRLDEKTSQKVVLESQITIDRPGQPLVENPSQKVEITATFRLPPGMTIEQFALPSLKAKLVSEEPRTVCGREFPTQIFTWEERNEAGPMTVKYWRSDEIPGRLLRQEITGRTQSSVEEVAAVGLPLSQPPGSEPLK